MDGPDLAPAKPKRARAKATVSVSPLAHDATTGELAARIGALESALRSVDVRLESIERELRAGFQESASRALAFAQATDERIDALATRGNPFDDVAVALVRLQATVDALAESDVRSELRLVSERLSTLLGGPSLTELMDRIDELGPRGAEAPEVAPPKRKRAARTTKAAPRTQSK